MSHRVRNIPRWVIQAKLPMCAACGATTDLDYHHLVPRARGGEDSPENIIVLCRRCHNRLHEKNGKERLLGETSRELIKEGLERAKAAGKRLGNPRKIAQHSTQFNGASLLTEDEVREMAGVKVTCYAECKNELLAALDQPVWPYEWPRPEIRRNRPLYPWQIDRIKAGGMIKIVNNQFRPTR